MQGKFKNSFGVFLRILWYSGSLSKHGRSAYDRCEASAGREGRAGPQALLRDHSRLFCRGVSYYKLFWVFFIASFLGAITETLFMLLTRGELQNRSGLIYGQFSLVWGLGAVLFTVCFHRLTGRRDLVSFWRARC